VAYIDSYIFVDKKFILLVRHAIFTSISTDYYIYDYTQKLSQYRVISLLHINFCREMENALKKNDTSELPNIGFSLIKLQIKVITSAW
jgi:hypothetical protein